MAVSLNSNILSLRALGGLGKATSAFSKAVERLSSGKRINHASDDAAGLSIASGLNAGARVLGQAILNVNDGISALNVAQGGVQNLSSILQRQLELAAESANGVYSSSQRSALNREANELVNEFNRIVATTSFNGTNLLNSSSPDLVIQQGVGARAAVAYRLTNGFSSTTTTTDVTAQRGLGTFGAGSGSTFISNGISSVDGGVDFDGDGIADYVTVSTPASGQGSGVVVNLSGGGGQQTLDSNAGNVSQITYADLNGDGLIDITYLNNDTGTVSTYLNRGGGAFAGENQIGASVTSFTVGDFNGDGNQDIAYNTGNKLLNLSYLDTNGAESSSSFFDMGTVGINNPVSLVAGDFNGDGHTDLVVNSTQGLGLLTGNGAGGFAGGIFGAQATGDLQVGDLNGDGRADVVAGGSLIYYTNAGGGVQDLSTSGFGPASNTRLVDMNGDGLLDIVRLDTGEVILNDATHGFTSSYSITPNSAVGDFNGDGYADLAYITDQGSGPHNIDTAYQDFGTVTISSTTTTSTTGSVLGQSALDLTTVDGARSALTSLRDLQDQVNTILGNVGAGQSRLSTSLSVLQASKLGFENASSRITDADVAAESANMVSAQIRQQIIANVLSHADQQPALALQLLRP